MRVIISIVLQIGVILTLCSCGGVNARNADSSIGNSSQLVSSSVEDRLAASLAVRKLWSGTEQERQEGIDDIHRLGGASVEPLISLLKDLLHDPRARFPIGKEKEGAKVLRDYIKGPRNFELAMRLGSFVINSRLMSDSVRLLGDLRAEQAVPVLVEIMNKNLRGNTAPEIYALRSIGSPAVPELIKDLDELQIRTYGFGEGIYSWSVEVEGEEGTDTQQQPTAEDADDDSSDLEEINLVRERVVDLLAAIRDQRALPVLERLLQSSQDDRLIGSIKGALSQIQRIGPNKSEPPPRLEPAPMRPPIH